MTEQTLPLLVLQEIPLLESSSLDSGVSKFLSLVTVKFIKCLLCAFENKVVTNLMQSVASHGS